jgi:hypothetical protein
VGRGERARNPFPIGPALLWLPGYLVGLLIDLMLSAVGFGLHPLGYGVGAVWGVAVSSIAMSGYGFELSRRLARRLVNRRAALPATVLIWGGTAALYYTLVTPLYSHGVASFAVALTLWLTYVAADPVGSKGLKEVLAWALAGLVAGFAVGIRLQDAPLLLFPIAALGWIALRRNGWLRPMRISAAWGCGVLVGYAPQGLTWYWLHGSWLPFGDLDRPRSFSVSKLGSVLFSTGYEGWISWTPIVALGLAGLLWMALSDPARRSRVLAAAALVGILGLVILDVIHPYGAGAAYGGRRYVSATPVLIVGLAALMAGQFVPRSLRWAVWPLAVLLALANLWLIAAYELLVVVHGVYPSLAEALRYAVGAWPG